MQEPLAAAGEEPQEALPLEPAPIYVITSDCMGCGICLPMCPVEAIVEARHQLVILKRRCDGCGLCTPYCPVQAIVPKERFKERQARTLDRELRLILKR
jgi:ferredoxin